MTLKNIIILLFYCQIFISKTYAIELPAQLRDTFCDGPEYTSYITKVNLGSTQSQWELSCEYGYKQNLTSFIIFEKLEKQTVRILLDVENVFNYEVLDAVTNNYHDISLILIIPENEPLYNPCCIKDTIFFDGFSYKKKTNHSDLIRINNDVSKEKCTEIYEKLKSYFVEQNSNTNAISQIHQTSLSLFKSGKKPEAAQLLLKSVGSKPWTIDNSNVAVFNDLGYFLTEAAQYKDAVDILGEVIAKFPDRTVAYLNIADAYSGLNNIIAAKKNYQKYIDMMTIDGKQAKIPKRVTEFTKK
jgi:tetratricopeptide (TPR) repeat protein